MPDMEVLDPDSDSDNEDNVETLRGWRGQWEDLGEEGDNKDRSEDEYMPDALVRIIRTIHRLIDSWYENHYEAPRDKYSRGPASLPHMLNVLKERRPDLSRRNLRVTPAVFDALVECIQGDSIFTKNSQNEQIPISHQLAITLFRFGHSGNAASQS